MSLIRTSAEAVEWLPPFTPSQDVISASRPQNSAEQGYRNVPILKRPLWGWEIAWYFFLGGISSGSFALCTAAELFGNGEYYRTTSIGRWLSLATLVPCPPLLIADLGRPERFHHMLRIVKLKSPMNLGSWTLAIYSLFAGLQVALEPVTRVLLKLPGLARLQSILPNRVSAVMGMPFAWTLLSYPGVLLSTTSIPIWGCSRTLGMLISASSMSSATAALSLIASFRNDKVSAKTLHRIEWIASGTEAATLSAYITSTGQAAKPLVRGMGSKLFWMGAVCAGIIAPALLRTKKSKTSSIVGSILTLAGAAALKWAIVHSGRESAMDRELAIHNVDSGHNAKPAKRSEAAHQEQNVPHNRAIGGAH